jgi:hypothetical protein
MTYHPKMSVPRDRRPACRVAVAVALATPVHLLSTAILALGIWLLWPGHGVWFGVLGLVCVLLAATLVLRPLRPMRHRLPHGTALDLRRSAATAELLRRVAAEVGSPVPQRCVVTATYAAATRTSIHRHTLEVGAPLWLALDTEERVALLARTLAPDGAARWRVDDYVAVAIGTLARWQDLLTPMPAPDPQSVYDPVIVATEAGVMHGRAEYRLGVDAVWVLLSPLRLVAAGYRRLLEAAASPMRRAATDRVEQVAAAAAGVAALDGLQRALRQGEVVASVLQHATRTGTDLQTALVERTARLYADQLIPASPAAVEVDLEEWARIDQEWAPSVDEQFAELRSAYR